MFKTLSISAAALRENRTSSLRQGVAWRMRRGGPSPCPVPGFSGLSPFPDTGLSPSHVSFKNHPNSAESKWIHHSPPNVHLLLKDSAPHLYPMTHRAHYTNPTAFSLSQNFCVSVWDFQITQRSYRTSLHCGGKLETWKEISGRLPSVLMMALD